MTLGDRLAELKQSRSKLQKDIASSVDRPLWTYQRYEHGER